MIVGGLLLLALAAGILIYPALRAPKHEAEGPDQRQMDENLRLYRERMAELADSDLSSEERAAITLELDRELLDVAAVADNVARQGQPSVAARGVLVLFLVLATLASTYWGYGEWGALNEVRATQLLDYSARAQLTPQEADELAVRLKQATKSQPQNSEWAYLSGRLAESRGDYQTAAATYADVLVSLPVEQVEDRAAIMTLMVQARFFANDQVASEALYKQLLSVLELTPTNQKPLGLAGIMAYELGRYQQAINHWRVLWEQLPAGTEARTIENGIRRAAEMMNQLGQVADIDWLTPARIRIQVSLAAEVAEQLNANAPVFVIARDPSGPALPLAVQRLTVAQLPATVVLSDAMAMAEGVMLSGSEAVTVTARIALSGQPVAQPGDWQGQVLNVPTRGAPALTLVIDQQVN
ncbi:MAG: c-type cytochrome biogenesis protein CcmI [Pseudomonadota bacterium]|nr:c-type cytochrome biogenesis protein CcmI [Pseudomonadota bacterium]